MLSGLVKGTVGQEVSRGARLTDDPNFPVFQTPVNEDILVYFPKTNVVSNENGETMEVLESHIHDYKKGQAFGRMRCINGLQGNEFFDALGYDGTCPACEAVGECWELYNKKLAAEAKRLGVDPQNDPTNVLKTIKENIRSEMDMKGAEEYVTFPIVIIPQKVKMIPADDAAKNLKCVFVTWRKKRYQDSILAALDTLRNNPGHPAGLFWYWKFTYDTQGKQPTAMLAAKNAKYSVITDAADMQSLIPACEEKAKDFTNIKAAEVIVANQFMYKDDIIEEVDKIMAKTRTFNELAGAGISDAPALGEAASPLANFGAKAEPAQITGNLGTAEAPTAPATPQFGATAPATGFGAPTAGSPVQFG